MSETRRSFELPECTALTLRVDEGEVHVLSSTANRRVGVEVSCDDALDDMLDMSTGTAEGRAVFEARRKGFWFWRRPRNLRFTAIVPSGQAVHLAVGAGDIHVENADNALDIVVGVGSIFLSGLSGSVNASTLSGNVRLKALAGSVVANTKAGDIVASALGGAASLASVAGSVQVDGVAGDLDAATDAGAIRVTDAAGAIVGRGGVGDMEIRFAKGSTGRGDFELQAGRMTLELDPAVRRRFSLDVQGSVDSALDLGPPAPEATGVLQMIGVRLGAGTLKIIASQD